MIEPAIIPDDMVAIGTCSRCWGPVCRPAYTVPPEPVKTACIVCGAVPRPMYGAVVLMVPASGNST